MIIGPNFILEEIEFIRAFNAKQEQQIAELLTLGVPSGIEFITEYIELEGCTNQDRLKLTQLYNEFKAWWKENSSDRKVPGRLSCSWLRHDCI